MNGSDMERYFRLVRNKLPVRPLSKGLDQLGLLNLFLSAYTNVYTAINGRTYTISVNGATATFDVKQGPTPKELLRIQTLFGERNVLRDFVASISSEDVVYDVGANIGLYSCLSSGTASHTIAIEPNDFWKKQLQHNLCLNDGEVTHIDEFLATGEGQTIAGIELASEFNIPLPTVLKIDVDGTEGEVLQGFNLLELSSCRLIYIEVHPKIMDCSPEYVEDQLQSAGFSLSRLHDRSDEYFIRAER
jgi:hypothetical protein